MEYEFFYDEAEHSRKINYKTITAENYYDNFIAVIVGWDTAQKDRIREKHEAFEEKYKERASHGELKSTTIKQEQLKYGFASLNKQNVQFLDDFFSLFTGDTYIYFSVISKVEYIVRQILQDYADNPFVNIRAMEYSMTKAILTYKPESVLKAIYEEKDSKLIVKELVKFFQERIEYDKRNYELKEREINAFIQVVWLLESVQQVKQIEWNYEISFEGLQLFLEENNIDDYKLVLDKEGDCQNTLKAALRMGIKNVSEEDSKANFGIRISDMLAGVIARMMKSLSESLRSTNTTEKPEKRLLSKEWFMVNDAQLNLYKKLYHIICKLNNVWYKSYAGVYADDLVSFIALLNYMNQVDNADDMRNRELEMEPEYFNTCVCQILDDRYKAMSDTLPVEVISDESEEYFFNDRGGKIYFDIKKQPVLHVTGSMRYKVLSVGYHCSGVPLVTIDMKTEIQCYVLPDELTAWALTVIKMSNEGMNLFPAEVIFSEKNGRYFADIL